MENITIVGLGYVGMSLAIILSKNNNITAIDTDKKKLDLIKSNKPTINDSDVINYYNYNDVSINATNDSSTAYKDADFIIIAVPTNYDEGRNYFDTSSIELVIKDILDYNTHATIVIKSTIPVGYITKIKKYFNYNNIFFSPEFLREGFSLSDNLYPSRIIVGDKTSEAKKFGYILAQSAEKKDIPILFMNSEEAEAVKLFANSYLALRVAYFNELDSYAISKNLSTRSIIEGVSLDSRIGNFYNNPSFGYGGYCLPKDTKQLLANFDNIPQNIITAIVSSNETRINFLSDKIIKMAPKTIGIYRLIMKSESDNFRSSSVRLLIKTIKIKKNINFIIYEPNLASNYFEEYQIIADLKLFKKKSDLILANRRDNELEDVNEKLFTCDVFTRD
tara:strand:- start:5298 stop:6470 length:1173 start_codon:yes stop_codon:yes gene_type:complete